MIKKKIVEIFNFKTKTISIKFLIRKESKKVYVHSLSRGFGQCNYFDSCKCICMYF